MQAKIVQLNKQDHAKVKLKPSRNYSHVAGQHITPVIVHEISSAAIELPVAFVKSGSGDEYICVAILGLKEKENLMVGADGLWNGEYIPAGFTHYPLSLVPHPEDNKKYSISISMESDAINEDEGDALYNAEGGETEYLDNRRQTLENYYNCAMITREFVKTLTDLDLLEPQEISFSVGEEKRSVSGVHIVSEKKLNELAEDKFLDLRKKGYLPAIYGHLISLKQTHRLVKKLSTKK